MSKIQDEFVPYELAKQLKEIGFDEPCLAIYRDRSDDCGVRLISEGMLIKGTQHSTTYYSNDKYMICLAPLYQQVIQWFAEKHELFIETPKIRLRGYGYVVELKQYNKRGKLCPASKYYQSDTLFHAIASGITEAIHVVNKRNVILNLKQI